MKKLLLTILLGCFALVGFSQARFDVKVGMSMTNVTANDETDMKVGYALGVGMDYAFNENWAFQPGIMFTGKGYKVGDVKAKAHYLDIPLLAAYKMPVADDVKFVINAGPYLAFGIGGKNKWDDEGISISTDYFGDDGAKRFDLGLQYGVGAEFSDCILLNLTGQYGFISPFEHSDSKNLAFFITLGYRF